MSEERAKLDCCALFAQLLEQARKEPSVRQFFSDQRARAQALQIQNGANMSPEVYAVFEQDFQLWDALLSESES